MTLDILIATVVDRHHLFIPLLKEFEKQIFDSHLENKVNIIYIEDNKEISVGAKRQHLLELATADYIVFFDSDDFPKQWYVNDIYNAIQNGTDCVGFLINMTTNGTDNKTCCHRLKYKYWNTNIDGYDYVRNVTHFNPVKRELALQVGFKDLRFGEDKDYSDRLTLLCENEIFIDKYLFDYRYSNLETHNKKYGIK